MTIILYDFRELQERPPRHLNAWKAWHLILYVFVAAFGIMNYVFLQNTMELINDNCVLFPRELEFHAIERPEAQNLQDFNEIHEFNKNLTDDAQPEVNNATNNGENDEKVKRDTSDKENVNLNEPTTMEANATMATSNGTHYIVLDTSRSLFQTDADCMFAEYMPLMSTVFAAVWMTLFTMCPSGGHARTGLTQPWRILAPALLFALVMVGVTGHSFTLTNGGLHAFCEAFYQYTNSTTCSAVDPFIELGWNKTWGMGGRTSATKAASAGMWASWACVAALLLARCLAAPDFVVRRTSIYLNKDPQEKIIPHLKKYRKSPRSNRNTPIIAQEDNASMRSEPTVTTELVTASVEQGESAPTSLMVTPVKNSTPHHMENIELTYNPQERFDSLQ